MQILNSGLLYKEMNTCNVGPEADLGTGSGSVEPLIDLVHSYFLSILNPCYSNQSHYLGPLANFLYFLIPSTNYIIKSHIQGVAFFQHLPKLTHFKKTFYHQLSYSFFLFTMEGQSNFYPP